MKKEKNSISKQGQFLKKIKNILLYTFFMVMMENLITGL